jgi:hypothetical protein
MKEATCLNISGPEIIWVEALKEKARPKKSRII